MLVRCYLNIWSEIINKIFIAGEKADEKLKTASMLLFIHYRLQIILNSFAEKVAADKIHAASMLLCFP
jgi:hypothetical protein